MLRFVAILMLALASPAFAQVTQQDESLQQQLVPESFKLEGSAIAQQFNWMWNTTVAYSVTNNSGMNLYLGIMINGIAIGSCANAERATGALQLLPSPNAVAYSQAYGAEPPRGVFVPAGGRAAGTIVIGNCPAPNPGFPTAPLSISLMIGKSEIPKTMIQFPLSADVPIRQLQSQ